MGIYLLEKSKKIYKRLLCHLAMANTFSLIFFNRVLPKHIRMVHGNIGDRKTVGCDECDAQLSSKGSLRLHKVTQHGFDDGRGDVHTCEVCNYKTLQAHRMRKHRLTHQERRFECGAEGCFFSAGSANGLTAHMKMHGQQAAN